MGASSKSHRAGDAARSLGSNPYVRRLIEDEELRANLRAAFGAARNAYSRMANGKAPAKALMDDRKVHRDLRSAADSLKEASEQLRGKRRKRRWGRLLVLGLIGAGVVLIVSEDARKALLDRLFGAEEEFEYTSTTSSPEPETATTQAP